MEFDYGARVALPVDVLVRQVEQESVILNLVDGRYFGLDEIGTAILQILSDSDSIQAAYDTLLSSYDVEPERLREDLDRLLVQLLQAELLELH